MIHNIHHLHCGTMCPACAPLVSQTGLQAHIICHCLLLETDRGLVLIDTGLGLQDYLHTQQRLGRLIHQFGKIEINIQLSAVQQNKTTKRFYCIAIMGQIEQVLVWQCIELFLKIGR